MRGHAVSYTAGVLVAFAALGGALLAARAAGTAAGWGFQFASPVFVAAMAWLLFAVGLNLSGRVRDRQPAGRRRAAPGRARRAHRQLLHRAAGGAGRHPVHRAVHGRGDRRRAGRAAGR